MLDGVTSTLSGGGSVEPIRTVGGSSIEIPIQGKFYVGDTIRLRFSASFDQDAGGYSSGDLVCNDAEINGEDTGQATAQACLTVAPCGDRQCEGEIYGTDFLRSETNTGSAYGTVSVQ